MSQTVLTLNAGSSSVKFAVFESDIADLTLLARGEVEEIGTATLLTAKDSSGQTLISKPLTQRRAKSEAAPEASMLRPLFDWIEAYLQSDGVAAVGHRIVHGGMGFSAPVLIDADVVSQLMALRPLAPLHQPHGLAAIAAAESAWPSAAPRSPVSTPPSITATATSSPGSPCPAPYSTRESVDTVSTACLMSSSRKGCVSSIPS
jgi:acetate kinase